MWGCDVSPALSGKGKSSLEIRSRLLRTMTSFSLTNAFLRLDFLFCIPDCFLEYLRLQASPGWKGIACVATAFGVWEEVPEEEEELGCLR